MGGAERESDSVLSSAYLLACVYVCASVCVCMSERVGTKVRVEEDREGWRGAVVGTRSYEEDEERDGKSGVVVTSL
jgi:hypothetical protein